MGSNSTQARGIALFLVAFTLLAGAFATGGNVLLLLGALVTLAMSCYFLLRCKPWEQQE